MGRKKDTKQLLDWDKGYVEGYRWNERLDEWVEIDHAEYLRLVDQTEYQKWMEWLSDAIGGGSEGISRNEPHLDWNYTAHRKTEVQMYSLKAIALGIKQLVDQGNANIECLKEIRDAVNRSRLNSR